MTMLIGIHMPRIYVVGVLVVMRMRVEDLDCGGGVYGDLRRVFERMAVGKVDGMRRVESLHRPSELRCSKLKSENHRIGDRCGVSSQAAATMPPATRDAHRRMRQGNGTVGKRC